MDAEDGRHVMVHAPHTVAVRPNVEQLVQEHLAVVGSDEQTAAEASAAQPPGGVRPAIGEGP